MEYRIDINRAIPIYVQIAENIKLKIAQGELEAESKLPSVRELALHLKVNPNTVQAAYRELLHSGLVYRKKGIGLFVKKGENMVLENERKIQMEREIEKVVNFGMRLGYSPYEIEKMVSEVVRRIKNG